MKLYDTVQIANTQELQAQLNLANKAMARLKDKREKLSYKYNDINFEINKLESWQFTLESYIKLNESLPEITELQPY